MNLNYQTVAPGIYYIDDFLSNKEVKNLNQEITNVTGWSNINKYETHVESYYDYQKLHELPYTSALIKDLQSAPFLKFLSSATNINTLQADPYCIGTGYQTMSRGDVLKPHLDFNWNDTIKQYRRVNVIYYAHDDWDESWGGTLEYYQNPAENPYAKVVSVANRLLFWVVSDDVWHGFCEPLSCPNNKKRITFGLWYYTNHTAQPSLDQPPRKTLWYNDGNIQP